MKTQYLSIAIIFCFILFFSCKKNETLEDENKIEFGTISSSEISYITATVTTQVNSINGSTILQHGHCWGTQTNPEVSGLHTSLGSLTQATSFSSNLENLLSNTTYYIRSYITTSDETIYGSEITIHTLKTGKPVLGSTTVSEITVHSAVVRDSVEQDSGLVVLERGFCWHTDQALDLENCLDSIKVGEGLGLFTDTITDLEDGQDYWVKAYAKNEAGITYGASIAITTLPITVPVVRTTSISEITGISAQSGGEIVSNGNAEIIACGVLWSTAENPTLENKLGFTEDELLTNIFVSSISGLQNGTNYFVRAYASNSEGTGYGDVIELLIAPLKEQSISFISATEVYVNDELELTATASSGLDVSFEVVTGNASLVGNTITFNEAGTVSIRAYNDGNDEYAAAEQIVDISIVKREQSISFTPATEVDVNDELELTATASSGLDVSFEVVTGSSSVHLVGNTITFNEVGTVSIRAYNDGNDEYAAAEQTVSITVGKRGQSISFTPATEVYVNDEIELIATVSSGLDVSFELVSGSSLVNLVGNTITFNESGTVSIRAYNEGNDEYAAVEQTVSIRTIFLTDLRDGQTYELVKIGEQVWMAENLNYETNGWVYDDNSSNAEIYGRLYTWETAQNVCPSGWHLPSKAEFETLLDNFSSGSEAYWALKKGGSSNFNALFGGYRYIGGGYYKMGQYGYFWSSNVYDSLVAWYLIIYNPSQTAGMAYYDRRFGRSVRCLQD